MSAKVVIALNSAWNLVNFRSGLIKALITHGYEVIAVAPFDKYAVNLQQLGCRFVELPIQTHGTNPFSDLKLLWHFYLLLKRENPDIYLGYTIKPNVYGSLAAHKLHIPVINNIAGLGTVFTRDTWITHIVRKLYRLALIRSAKVFFQNKDDRELFISHKLINPISTDVVPGSGVDLTRFNYSPLPLQYSPRPLSFLLVARMLWDKGVGEYVAAAKIIKQKFPNTKFLLLGFLDDQNSAAVSQQQMNEWQAEGVVEYLGISDDVAAEIAKVDCVVLPSYYREGVPKTLLEAAAVGRPIITTDAVGCREVVNDGVNGYLCRPRDAVDLAYKIKKIIGLSFEERIEMGRKGREKVEREFDEKIVIQKYLDAIEEILKDK